MKKDLCLVDRQSCGAVPPDLLLAAAAFVVAGDAFFVLGAMTLLQLLLGCEFEVKEKKICRKYMPMRGRKIVWCFVFAVF